MTSLLIAFIGTIASGWAVLLVRDDNARKNEGAALGAVQLCIVAMLLLIIAITVICPPQVLAS